MKYFNVFGALILLGYSCFAAAATMTTTIDFVGCHISSNMCFLYVKDTISSTCPNKDKSFRWDGGNGPNRKEIMSIILSAQARGVPIQIGGVGDLCYKDYPSFYWIRVGN